RRARAAAQCDQDQVMRTLLDVVLLDVVVIASLTAQAEGSPVLLLPASTRSAGLGGAGAALVGDAGAVFANPAGIATIRHLSVEGSYERYLAGATLSAAALALRLGRLNWGAGAAALDYGAGSAADLLGVSSLVFRTGVIALGGSGKYFRQEVGGSSAHAWAGDAGVAIAVFDIMALGASVQNIGGGRSGAPPLPRRTRAGFTMNYVDPQGTFRLLTTVEGQWPEGHAAVLVAGLEAGVVARGGGAGGGAHPLPATADRAARGGRADPARAAPAAGARAGGAGLRGGRAAPVGRGHVHDLRGHGPRHPAARALRQPARPAARLHVAVPDRGRRAVQGVLQRRAGAPRHGGAGARCLRHLPSPRGRVLHAGLLQRPAPLQRGGPRHDGARGHGDPRARPQHALREEPDAVQRELRELRGVSGRGGVLPRARGYAGCEAGG